MQTENPAGEGADFQPENETGSADNQSVGKITEWLDTENLKKATGKSRDEIYELFGNTPEPIAKISEEYIKYLDPDIQDSTVYCGKGYFIDHAVNHHPEVTPSEYQKIPEILAYPDDVKLDTKNKERHSLVFIKKYDNNKIVIVSTYEDNDKKLVFHKSFFYSKNTPYKSLTSVRGDLPLSGATSDISHADASAPAGNRLSGRNGKETPPTQGKSFDNQINHSGVNILSSTGADKSSDPLFQLDRDGEMNELHKIQEAYLAAGNKEDANLYAGQAASLKDPEILAELADGGKGKQVALTEETRKALVDKHGEADI